MSRALVGARERWKQGDLADLALVGARHRWPAMIQVVIQRSPHRPDQEATPLEASWLPVALATTPRPRSAAPPAAPPTKDQIPNDSPQRTYRVWKTPMAIPATIARGARWWSIGSGWNRAAPAGLCCYRRSAPPPERTGLPSYGRLSAMNSAGQSSFWRATTMYCLPSYM